MARIVPVHRSSCAARGVARRALVGSLVALLLACGPVSFVPGVRLGGTEQPTPATWESVQIPDEVQLAAHGGWIPRVVNIWAVEASGAIYVGGDRASGWVRRAVQDPRVELRIRDAVYALSAVAVETEDERREIRAAYMAKYGEQIRAFAADAGIEPEEFGADGAVFRLERRP